MKKFLSAVILLLLLSTGVLRAQFTTNGDDPGRLKWNQIKGESFRVVYPEEADSLAQIYLNSLEKWRTPVSWSIGLKPGEKYRPKTPLILHTYNGTSNASVTWAPKRMEFYTLPEAYDPDPIPWEKLLSIHESRHTAQMELGYTGWFRPFTWLFGDMIPGSVVALYPNTVLLEGDAVVAETALTQAGRGRSASFLNYYMSAFDSGDWRSWYSWRYGSWRRYSPDHYTVGYMTIAGTRVFYDDPFFMGNYYERIRRNPIRFFNLHKELKLASGMKFSRAWDGITDGFHQMWTQNALARGPFVEGEQIVRTPSWYEDWNGGEVIDGDYYVLRSGLLQANSLMKVSQDGKIKRIRPFSYSAGMLNYDGNTDRIYWSETVGHPRWSLEATSRIRYMDMSDPRHRFHDLTTKGRIYNPKPSPDGTKIIAVEYLYSGGTDMVVIDSQSGEIVERYHGPSGMQLVEPIWHDGRILVSTVSEEGMGIYEYDGDYRVVLPPAHTTVYSFSDNDGRIIFASDRTGVSEVYELVGNEVYQLTSTPYGAGDALLDGETLYFTTQQTGIPRRGKFYGEGRLPYTLSSDKFLGRKVDFADIYRNPVAEELSRQEKELAGSEWNTVREDVVYTPKKYSKLVHIPRFHTWAPVSINYDDFSSLNMDIVTSLAGLGATAFFQNDLGTAQGSLTYGYIPGANPGARHSARLKFTYSGLFPVFDIDANIGDRPQMYSHRQYHRLGENDAYETVSHTPSQRPTASLDLSVYVPLRFNSGGWYRGVTPRFRYSVSNDVYDKSLAGFDHSSALEGMLHKDFLGNIEGDKLFRQSMLASVSGYVMLPTAPSAEYPRLGAGLETGYRQRIGLADLYSSAIYAHAYGYLPGIVPQQGMKLSLTTQHRFEGRYGENTLNLAPRGFSAEFMDLLAVTSENQLKCTIDYSVPFAVSDRQWGASVFHATHCVIKPHFDGMVFDYMSPGTDMSRVAMVGSVGAEVTLHLSNFLWIPYPTRIGFTFDLNGGPSYKKILSDGCELSDRYIGFVFDVSL